MGTEGVEFLPESDYQYSPTSQYGTKTESPLQKLTIDSGHQKDSLSRRSGEDYMGQMSEKIRAQARLLQDLEAYKLLCEKRILELAPGHPLPIQQEHLGKCIIQFFAIFATRNIKKK